MRYLNAEALQRRTFIAIRTLIEMQAKTAPVVFMIDDIHWMDQASLDLLEYLLPLTDAAADHVAAVVSRRAQQGLLEHSRKSRARIPRTAPPRSRSIVCR